MADIRGPLGLAAIGLAVSAVPVYADMPPTEWLPDLVVGTAALALAWVSWRNSKAVSSLALLVAVTWWVGTIWPVALYWHRGVFIHLVLSVPRGWPRSRAGAVAVGGGYLAALATPVWQTQDLAAGLAGGVLLAGLIEARARRSVGFIVGPLLFVAAVAVGVLVPEPVGEESGALAALIGYDAILVIVLLWAGLRTRLPTRAALTDLAVDLGRTPVRDVTTLMELVRAEPGLALDRDIQAALTAARRLEEGNERVREEVRAALREVDESRRRLVITAAAERARLAEQLTRTTAEPLRELAQRAALAGVVAPGLTRALGGLDAAMAGLRPPGLAAGGLATALREHPLVATLDATLETADDRLDEVVEDTLYAVAVEGLTNVAKYAGACRVTVGFATAGAVARLTVRDDGPGGAVPDEGTGLTGLADRLEALGGSLAVASTAGVGTTIMASVPLAAMAAAHRPPLGADKQAGG
jgi:glucose-6-phosphate-specific signal transduction histidine kinase